VNKGIATQVFTKMPEDIGDIDEMTEEKANLMS
jgi:hypothetical protein